MALDAQIDELYQRPLGEFTAARNALARDAGTRSAEIRQLAKPPLAAWAINQVYWRERPTYTALIEAATELREAHAAVLAGRGADVRGTGKSHDEAVEAAVKSALAILKADGHPATDATRQALMTTLRALPAEDPPGRLARTLQPGGFEMLAGMPVRGRKAPVPAPAPRPPKAPSADRAESSKAREEAAAAARAKEQAERTLRHTEHTARRDEFEAARQVREAEKAARAVESAREALVEAQRGLEEAERDRKAADKARDAAARRADTSRAALEEARAALRKLR